MVSTAVLRLPAVDPPPTSRRPALTPTTAALLIVIGAVGTAIAPTSNSAAATGAILRPSHDISRQWTGTPGSATSAINDPVSQPTAVDATNYIYGSVAGRVTEVAIADTALGGGTATSSAYFYANTGTTTTLRVDVVVGTIVRHTTTVSPAAPFGWRSVPIATLSEQQLNDLRLRFTVVGGGDSNVRAAYVQVGIVTAAPPPGPTPAERWATRSRNLAYHWAPYLLQDTDDSHPSGDYLSTVDFDGDWRTSNNWENQSQAPLVGAAYYSVAETATHWFITYAYYHPRDWAQRCDTGCVGGIYHRDEHENDMEGVLLVVRRGPLDDPNGSLQAAVTVAHHNFYSYVPAWSSFQSGAEDVDGGLVVAPMYTLAGFPPTPRQIGGPRPWILQEAKTHAIRAWRGAPTLTGSRIFSGGDGVIYWPSDTGSVPAHGNDRHARYALIDMFAPTGLWAHRSCAETFYDYGRFRGDNGVDNNASAPWWWDDHSDVLPPGVLVSDPARLVTNYFHNTGPLSPTYTQLGKNDFSPTVECD